MNPEIPSMWNGEGAFEGLLEPREVGVDPLQRAEQKTQPPEWLREYYDLGVALKSVLKSPEGKKVRAWLEGILVAPTWNPDIPEKSAIFSGFAREGENGFVRDIFQRIKIVTQYPTFDAYLAAYEEEKRLAGGEAQ